MSSAPKVSTQRYGDASEQERALAGWWQNYCQLKPGRYEGRVDTLDLPGVTVTREAINVPVGQRTAPPPGRVVFVKTLDSAQDLRMNAVPVRSSEVLVVRHAEEQVVAFGGPSDILMISVDEEKLDPGQGRRLPSVYAAPTTETFEFHAGWVLSLLASMAALEGGPLPDLAMVLPGLITDRLQHFHSKLFGRSGRALDGRADVAVYRRARAIAEAEDGEPLSVAELAARAGVPPDVLREAFLKVAGVGPGNWLRSRRLDGARRDLLKARGTGISVSDVATRWGFWHFGRFAATYADYFGESPSATLRGGSA
jgi:AraC family ethanolamine operon transcriptional activator